ncbi:MAG: acyl-ACP--UDP-N-acetylglucosamine O-acyltransferase [Bacteroidales bacterium]
MISSQAYVDSSAKIGKDVTIMPFAYIDKNVEIGDGCTIMPYASILNGTRMGKNNIIHQGAIIGAEPQDFNYVKGTETFAYVGDNNNIREYVVIRRGTKTEGGTHIGNGSFLMKGTNISHDSEIGNGCIIGNSSEVTGCCIIEDSAIIASQVVLKPGVRVGTWAMVECLTVADKDIPPYIVAGGSPIEYAGVNAFIMSRHYFNNDKIAEIAKAYRQIYKSHTSLENAIIRIQDVVEDSSEIRNMIEFIKSSKIGIMATD